MRLNRWILTIGATGIIALHTLYLHQISIALVPIDASNGHHTLEKQCNRRSLELDFSHCNLPVKVAAKVSRDGLGHKLTEVFFIFRLAILFGYCFCFDASTFGYDNEIYRYVLQSIFPDCGRWNVTKEFVNYEDFQEKVRRNNSIDQLYMITIPRQLVWPEVGGLNLKGSEHLYSFMDSFLRDNCLISTRLYPWYKHHRISDAIVKHDMKDDFVYAVFHLRVGDFILDASEAYWENLLCTVRKIVDFEFGTEKHIKIYFSFFQAEHRKRSGKRLRDKLKYQKLAWLQEKNDLPSSHAFLDRLCLGLKSSSCFWKHSTSILESIDMYMTFDVVYLSGSSFSRVLGLFGNGIKIVALPKEINFFQSTSDMYMYAWTTTITSTSYYYVNENGTLFQEQNLFLTL
jgi:hypothetical protein